MKFAKFIKYFLILILASCSTTEHLRTEKGEPISSRKLKEESKTVFEVELSGPVNEKDYYIRIIQNNQIIETWENEHEKVDIQGMRCRGWRNFRAEYCEFDTVSFLLYNTLLIGSLVATPAYAIASPFALNLGVIAMVPYGDEVKEIEKPTNERISEKSQRVNDNRVSFQRPDMASIIINNDKYKLEPVNNQQDLYKISPSPAKFFELNGETLKSASFKIGNYEQNIVSEVKELMSERFKVLIYEKVMAHRPEKRNDLDYCSEKRLYSVIYNPFGQEIESDCLYWLEGPLKVIQTLPNGILVGLARPSVNLPDKHFFVRTNRSYTDNTIIRPMFVRYTGNFSYRTVLGGSATISSFQFVDDIKENDRVTGEELKQKINQSVDRILSNID